MKRPIFPAFLLLCACADSTVYLKNEKTGVVATCGSLHPLTLAEGTAQRRWDKCVQDYEAQGYVRVPKPN